MYLENGELSNRQMFRIGLLENISLGIVILPYVTLNIAGNWHFAAMLLGMLLVVLYSIILFLIMKHFPFGIMSEMEDKKSFLSSVVASIYFLRFIIRGGIILLYFGTVIKEYMLRNFNIWILMISFGIICGYGAKRDLEKRGRLLELLFWWMILPLILAAVFAVSSLDISAIRGELFVGDLIGNSSSENVLYGAYLVFLVMSTVEITILTLGGQKKCEIKNVIRMFSWVFLAILLAYVFELGILGYGWLMSSSTASLNVMEAAAVPGDFVTRMDYPVLSFWIIGVFAILSGYLYYAKEMLRLVCHKSKEQESWWIMCIVVAGLFLATFCWNRQEIAKVLANYMLHFDVAISLLLLFILWCQKGWKKRSLKRNVMGVFLICFMLMGTGCGKKTKQDSVEYRDFVVSMEVSATESLEQDKKYEFQFELVDLTDYKGTTKSFLKTSEYTCSADSVTEAIKCYQEENEQELDLGHIEEIVLRKEKRKKIEESFPIEYFDIIKEIGNMPQIPKSINVQIENEQMENEQISLRELIKKVYEGEEL